MTQRILFKLLIVAAAIMFGSVAGTGTAYAQAGGAPANPAPAGPGLTGENSTVRNGGDTFDRDSAMARDEAIAKSHSREGGKKIRSTPAKPEEITVGAEIRDNHGVRVGVIDSVSLGSAVLHADGGSVEVPLDAFGKDDKGLLIGMTKAEFDKLVADALKPQ